MLSYLLNLTYGNGHKIYHNLFIRTRSKKRLGQRKLLMDDRIAYNQQTLGLFSYNRSPSSFKIK